MASVEYVDIYDRSKNKTGIIKKRHVDPFEEGEYIIGVQIVIINDNNEILITKRSNNKGVYPGKWECNGGAIDAGETPVEGLEREMREELGITIDVNKLKYFKTAIDDEKHNIKEIYLYKANVDINDLSFSDDEVTGAKYVSIDEYMEMFNSGDIVGNVDFVKEDYEKAMEIR